MDISNYHYGSDDPNKSHGYLLPALLGILDGLGLQGGARRIFDLGCGNGSVAAFLRDRGYAVVGVDPSKEGISTANRVHPELQLFNGSAYDDLAETYGQFPVVISLEVVEHVYFPRKFARCIHSLLENGGCAVLSTPYHGYWKNLALSVTGQLDRHFTALWDDGHIKFWSYKTLGTLLNEAGLEVVEFKRIGRIAPLAKSMIAVAKKVPCPGSEAQRIT